MHGALRPARRYRGQTSQTPVRAAADGGGGRRVARTERFFGGCGTQQPQVGDRAGRRYAAGDRRSLGAGASERVAGNALPPAVAVVHAFRGALFRPLASGRSDRPDRRRRSGGVAPHAEAVDPGGCGDGVPHARQRAGRLPGVRVRGTGVQTVVRNESYG